MGSQSLMVVEFEGGESKVVGVVDNPELLQAALDEIRRGGPIKLSRIANVLCAVAFFGALFGAAKTAERIVSCANGGGDLLLFCLSLFLAWWSFYWVPRHGWH